MPEELRGGELLKTRTVVMWTTLATSLAVDFLSKEVVFRHYTDRETTPVIDGILWFTPRINTGAAFSFLAGFEHSNAVFLVVSILLLPILIWLCLKKFVEAPSFAFGLIAGGAIGNVIDRMREVSGVRDFIDLRWWPAFNIADACIFIGVAVLAIWMFFYGPKEDQQDTAADESC